MADYNRVVLVGNLTRDPECKQNSNGTPWTKASMAVNRKYYDRDNKLQSDVAYVDVNFSGKSAENVSRYLKRGDPLLVEGRLRFNSWETPEGQKRNKLEVAADSFRFLHRAAGGPGSADELSGMSGVHQSLEDLIP